MRLHAVFLVFAVFVLYLSTRDPSAFLVGYGLLAIGVLLGSVVLHEVGHALAGRRAGGGSGQIVLGPFGGLLPTQTPHEPQYELLVAAAGPLVNLALALATGVSLWASGVQVAGLLNPLQPSGLVENAPLWIVGLKLVCWINWVLVLVNLLPAFPLDGGRMLRSIFWLAFGYRTAVLVVTRGAMILAVGMCLIAWALRESAPAALMPPWFPLLMFAILLFFSAQQELARLEEQDPDEEFFNYDFSQGYTSLERHIEQGKSRPHTGPLRRRLESWREQRRRRQQLVEQDEERQMDEILARLRETGINGLSSKERALLERVSARYRNRQQS